MCQVIVNNPVPETHQNRDSFEDTLLLLDMVKEKKMKEMQQRKVCSKRLELFSSSSFNIFKSVLVASVSKNRYLSSSPASKWPSLGTKYLNEIFSILFLKDDMIRQMALEQKKKLEEKRKGQVHIKSPMF